MTIESENKLPTDILGMSDEDFAKIDSPEGVNAPTEVIEPALAATADEPVSKEEEGEVVEPLVLADVPEGDEVVTSPAAVAVQPKEAAVVADPKEKIEPMAPCRRRGYWGSSRACSRSCPVAIAGT